MADEQKSKSEVGAELQDFLSSGTEEQESESGNREDVKTEPKADTVDDSKPVATDKKVETETDVKVEKSAKTDVKVDSKVAKEEEEEKDDLVGLSDKELRSLVRGLRTRVDEVHGKLVTAGVAIKPEQKADTTVDTKTEQKIEKKVEAEVINFMKDVNMDEIIDSPEALNKLLVGVYNKAIEAAETRAVEKVLRSIPQLVVNYASRHATMADLVRDFYNTNQDLVPVKRTVATVANEVAAEHPDWEVKAVFDEAAARTRKLLGIQKREVIKPAERGNSPAFVRKGGSRRAAGADSSSMNDLQKEIAETLT